MIEATIREIVREELRALIPEIVAALRPPTPIKKYLNSKELAAHFGVSRRTIENWKRLPDFPFLLPAGERTYRFPVDDVRRWLQARRETTR